MEFGYNFSFMINITINGDFFVIGHSKTININTGRILFPPMDNT